MIDGGEADDKIVAEILQDNIWDNVQDVSGLPEALVGRMRYYFQIYKLLPEAKSDIFVEKICGAKHARKVVTAAFEDYENEIGS